MERVAVGCKRACLNSCAGLSGNFKFFFLFGKCSTSTTLKCEQYKRTKVSMQVPPVKAVRMPRRTLVEAMPEHVKNRAPPAPEGAPPQGRQSWPGPLFTAACWKGMQRTSRSEQELYQRDEFDVSRSWNARQRVIIRVMASYVEKNKNYLVGIWRVSCLLRQMRQVHPGRKLIPARHDFLFKLIRSIGEPHARPQRKSGRREAGARGGGPARDRCH